MCCKNSLKYILLIKLFFLTWNSEFVNRAFLQMQKMMKLKL